MRRDVALAGGTLLAAGLIIGCVVERFLTTRTVPAPGPRPATLDRRRTPRPSSAGEPTTDVLERYRAAAAV